jgi:hypothetical protein
MKIRCNCQIIENDKIKSRCPFLCHPIVHPGYTGKSGSHDKQWQAWEDKLVQERLDRGGTR